MIISIWMESVEARDEDDARIILTACCGRKGSAEAYRGTRHGQQRRTSWSRPWKLSWEAFRVVDNKRRQTQTVKRSEDKRQKRERQQSEGGGRGGSRSKTRGKKERRNRGASAIYRAVLVDTGSLAGSLGFVLSSPARVSLLFACCSTLDLLLALVLARFSSRSRRVARDLSPPGSIVDGRYAASHS